MTRNNKRILVVVFLFLLFIAFSFWFFRSIYSYLSPTIDLAATDILVVEGWLSEEALEKVKSEFQSNKYSVLISTGFPYFDGIPLSTFGKIEFNIENSKISVIPHGIINIVPKTELTRVRAREKLNLGRDDKVILFFGIITPYKGLDYLIKAMVQLKNKNISLIIAGKIDATADGYWENIQRIIKETDTADYIIGKIGYIPDAEIEVYFKAADVLILPYLHIFQSGVPFLAYNFGLPVIATDVGSLKDDIIDYQIGFICQKENPQDLADKIDLYFNSELYKNLEVNRDKIITYANEKYSWEKIGEKTLEVYKGLF